MPDADPPLHRLIRSRSDLLADLSDRRIAAAVREGVLHQFRRGWYVDAQAYRELTPEQRHRLHVTAVARDASGCAVMSHESAAVLWDLPLYRHSPSRVQMTTASPRRISSAPDVQRHVAPLQVGDTTEIDGIPCTDLARTVFDCIRSLPLEAALSIADAAERRMAAEGWAWDQDAALAWRSSVAAHLGAAGAARGIRQARWVAGFADGRAHLPGESVSRLQLFRLGFETPDLQVLVHGPDGTRFFVDFGFRGLRTFGEFDGARKYLDEALRAEKSVEQVLLEEKQREDWIRGTTQWRLVRWGSAHIATPEALARRLASFGIHAP